MSAKRKRESKQKALEKKAKLSSDELISNTVWNASDLTNKISLFMDMQSLLTATKLSKLLKQKFTTALHKRSKAIASLINPLTALNRQMKQLCNRSPDNFFFSVNRLVIVIFIIDENRAKFYSKADTESNCDFYGWNSRPPIKISDPRKFLDPDLWDKGSPNELNSKNVESFLATALLRKYPIHYAYFSNYQTTLPPNQLAADDYPFASKLHEGKYFNEIGHSQKNVLHLIWSNATQNNDISKISADLYYVSFVIDEPKRNHLDLHSLHPLQSDVKYFLNNPTPRLKLWPKFIAKEELDTESDIAFEMEEHFTPGAASYFGCWVTPFSIQEMP